MDELVSLQQCSKWKGRLKNMIELHYPMTAFLFDE